MNRSSKGFGITGVLVAVVFLFVTAVFTSSANACIDLQPETHSSSHNE